MRQNLDGQEALVKISNLARFDNGNDHVPKLRDGGKFTSAGYDMNRLPNL